MAYFPLFIDLTDKTVLIVGGGAVAARKAETCWATVPRLLVCAPHFVPELRRLSGVELLERAFAPELLEGVSLVLAATDDRALNRTVSQLCQERSIPVNVADDQGAVYLPVPVHPPAGAAVGWEYPPAAQAPLPPPMCAAPWRRSCPTAWKTS